VQDSPSKTVVIDAGIFAKLFLEESDSEDAIAFFDFARVNDLKLIAPDLFLFEVLAVAGPSIIGSSLAYDMIITFAKGGFMMIQLDEATIRQALTISNTGHAKSGFPTFYDSSYHALAVTSGGIFLTADKRHVAKTGAFGSVVLLDEWKSYFQQTQSS
jgi:predicted nucleic acid-binding protein